MPTNQDLVFACDRALAGIQEVKANAIRLAQLAQQITEAENKLRALEGQVEAAKQIAPQLEQFDQLIRSKRSELADLDAAIAKKHADHGAVTSALRDLRKQISGDPTHA
jgi:predicted  nucleic acid-binding Zn-ribbon protein